MDSGPDSKELDGLLGYMQQKHSSLNDAIREVDIYLSSSRQMRQMSQQATTILGKSTELNFFRSMRKIPETLNNLCTNHGTNVDNNS